MFSQRFIGSAQAFRPAGVGQTGLTELQKLQAEQSQAIMRAVPQGPEAIAAAGSQMNMLLTQKAAELKQAEEMASGIWWSKNWPLVAGGAAVLGLAGYFAFCKK